MRVAGYPFASLLGAPAAHTRMANRKEGVAQAVSREVAGTIKQRVETRKRPKSAGSGRAKGTPNKTTTGKLAQIDALFKDLGYDPAASLVEIANDPETPLDIRIALHRELHKYVRKAIPDDPVQTDQPSGGVAKLILAVE